MAIYNLEEDLDVFIAPRYYGDKKFDYTMIRFDSKESRTTICCIDLETDKLMIYGTEIEVSMLQRLHESLLLRNKSGYIYVNCIGACHFRVNGKDLSPIQNVIFDWSPYGVIVPNSSFDSLKQKLEQKEDEVKEIKAELLSTKIESEKEVKELKEQLLTCQNNQHEMGLKLEKVCTRLSLVDFESEICKIELKSSKNEVNELQHRLSIYMEEVECLEAKLLKVQDQRVTSNLELELSRRKVLELKEELSIYKNESQGMKTELHTFKKQIFSANSELEETKKQLQSSNVRIIDLGTQLDSLRIIVEELEEHKMDTQGTRAELQSVQDRLSATDCELHLTKVKLESYRKHTQGLKDHILSIDSKLKNTNEKLEQLLVSMIWSKLEHEHPLLGSNLQICSQAEEDNYEDFT